MVAPGRQGHKGLHMVKFETGLRRYGQRSKFTAAKPWDYHGQEKSLDRVQTIDQVTLEKTGFQQNTLFKSVERIDRAKHEIRDRLPDHLSLPKYSDKFVARNGASFVTEMVKDKHVGKTNLNAIKFLMDLRCNE